MTSLTFLTALRTPNLGRRYQFLITRDVSTEIHSLTLTTPLGLVTIAELNGLVLA
jgi:hypothetical protein